MTEFSETNQNVNESLDETSVNEKLKNCQIFVTILHNFCLTKVWVFVETKIKETLADLGN